jgi:hypothetical protein
MRLASLLNRRIKLPREAVLPRACSERESRPQRRSAASNRPGTAESRPKSHPESAPIGAEPTCNEASLACDPPSQAEQWPMQTFKVRGRCRQRQDPGRRVVASPSLAVPLGDPPVARSAPGTVGGGKRCVRVWNLGEFVLPSWPRGNGQKPDRIPALGPQPAHLCPPSNLAASTVRLGPPGCLSGYLSRQWQSVDRIMAHMSHVRVAAVSCAMLVAVPILGGCGSAADHAAASTPDVAALATPSVIYKVFGSANRAFLTLSTPTGQSQQTASLPLFNRTGSAGLIFHDFSPGDFVYVSAQNKGDSGSVTCQILVDNVVISTNTSYGGYGIATCQGKA